MADDIKQLLELAAKAAGLKLETASAAGNEWSIVAGTIDPWQPHLDDGDSRRLEVALQMSVARFHDRVEVTVPLHKGGRWDHIYSYIGQDRAAIDRLAVLRAAAAVGREMP